MKAVKQYRIDSFGENEYKVQFRSGYKHLFFTKWTQWRYIQDYPNEFDIPRDKVYSSFDEALWDIRHEFICNTITIL